MNSELLKHKRCFIRNFSLQFSQHFIFHSHFYYVATSSHFLWCHFRSIDRKTFSEVSWCATSKYYIFCDNILFFNVFSVCFNFLRERSLSVKFTQILWFLLVSKLCYLFYIYSLHICCNIYIFFKLKCFRNTMAHKGILSFILACEEIFSVNLARWIKKLPTPELNHLGQRFLNWGKFTTGGKFPCFRGYILSDYIFE